MNLIHQHKIEAPKEPNTAEIGVYFLSACDKQTTYA